MLFSEDGFCMDPKDLGRIFVKYDKNADDKLSQDELASVYRDILTVVLDKDEDIDASSKAYMVEEVPDFADGAAEASFKRIDQDGNGSVSVSEFTSFLLEGNFAEILPLVTGESEEPAAEPSSSTNQQQKAPKERAEGPRKRKAREAAKQKQKEKEE